MKNITETLGYRTHRKARSTGTTVILVDGIEQGIAEEGLRWFLICEDHNQLIGHETQPLARSWMSAPEQWCGVCRGDDLDPYGDEAIVEPVVVEPVVVEPVVVEPVVEVAIEAPKASRSKQRALGDVEPPYKARWTAVEEWDGFVKGDLVHVTGTTSAEFKFMSAHIQDGVVISVNVFGGMNGHAQFCSFTPERVVRPTAAKRRKARVEVAA